MNIAQLHEEKAHPPPKILIYGDVGCGKTVLALTLGEGTQVIDCDLGLRSGYSLQDDFTDARRAVDVKQFPETHMPKTAVAFAKMKSTIYDIATQCNQKRYPYKAVILDSLTVFGECALNYILSNSSKLGTNPQIQHWGMCFTEMKMVLGVLRGLPIPVVVIGHQALSVVGKDKEAEDRIGLSIKGKNMPAEVMSLFDEVWYMRIGGTPNKRKYIIQTVHNGMVLARSRACIPDMTDTSIGMWKLMELMGYKQQETATEKLTATETEKRTTLKLTT